MTNLLPRHVTATEASRLGVDSGWYGTKVSGTFVTGPFPTEAECMKKITEIGPISQDRPSSFNSFRRVAGVLALCCVAAGTLMLSCLPAAALYAEIKPPTTVGLDCVGEVNVLAPKLTTCAIAGTKMRIWCPNGQMFEGAPEHGGLQVSLARSLCSMSQVP